MAVKFSIAVSAAVALFMSSIGYHSFVLGLRDALTGSQFPAIEDKGEPSSSFLARAKVF